ncbi:MAG TPA: hypothetical protein VEC18_06775, partial [Myxococcota bacterium]|nr:hypothetical protein [Myxococcota bacterium]
LESRLGAARGAHAAALRARLSRVRGALRWTLETQYPERLTEAHRHLRELDADIDLLGARYDAFVRARQAAVHGYTSYEAPIAGLRARIAEALERVVALRERQGEQLESVAIDELVARRDLLERHQQQARFAFADSYDRAAKAQARAQLQ